MYQSADYRNAELVLFYMPFDSASLSVLELFSKQFQALPQRLVDCGADFSACISMGVAAFPRVIGRISGVNYTFSCTVFDLTEANLIAFSDRLLVGLWTKRADIVDGTPFFTVSGPDRGNFVKVFEEFRMDASFVFEPVPVAQMGYLVTGADLKQ